MEQGFIGSEPERTVDVPLSRDICKPLTSLTWKLEGGDGCVTLHLLKGIELYPDDG